MANGQKPRNCMLSKGAHVILRIPYSVLGRALCAVCVCARGHTFSPSRLDQLEFDSWETYSRQRSWLHRTHARLWKCDPSVLSLFYIDVCTATVRHKHAQASITNGIVRSHYAPGTRFNYHVAGAQTENKSQWNNCDSRTAWITKRLLHPNGCDKKRDANCVWLLSTIRKCGINVRLLFQFSNFNYFLASPRHQMSVKCLCNRTRCGIHSSVDRFGMKLGRVQFVGAANARTCPNVITRFYISMFIVRKMIKSTPDRCRDWSILRWAQHLMGNSSPKIPLLMVSYCSSVVFFNFFGLSRNFFPGKSAAEGPRGLCVATFLPVKRTPICVK